MARDESNEGGPCDKCGRIYVPQRMERCPYCIIADLEAIVDTLPKCNRLVDGKLVCDKPVTPGMVLFVLHRSEGIIDECEVASLSRYKVTWTKPDSLEYIGARHDSCFDTREDAEAAKTTPPRSET